jgi:hypothetical protein
MNSATGEWIFIIHCSISLDNRIFSLFLLLQDADPTFLFYLYMTHKQTVLAQFIVTKRQAVKMTHNCNSLAEKLEESLELAIILVNAVREL